MTRISTRFLFQILILILLFEGYLTFHLDHIESFSFSGKVLQNNKKLSEYNVDGKVLHLVECQTPGSSSRSTDQASSSSATPRSSSNDAPGENLKAFLILGILTLRHTYYLKYIQIMN